MQYARLNKNGLTRLHEYVLRDKKRGISLVLNSQATFSIEPPRRSAIVLSDLLSMVTDYHALINSLTLAR